MQIDVHNHSLPGIDDGAKSDDMALAMVRRAAANGIRGIVLTPHHFNGVFVNSRENILGRVEALRELIQGGGIDITVYPGAENHLVPELPAALARGEAMTFNDRGCAALVELPKRTVPVGAENILRQIIRQGIIPVIAHPERNSELVAKPEIAARWVAMGCRLQLTALSCSGRFGRRIQSASRRWLEQGLIHVVASDAHRVEGREPNLAPARERLARWVGERNMEILTEENPARLVAGENLVPTQPVSRRRGMMALLFGR